MSSIREIKLLAQKKLQNLEEEEEKVFQEVVTACVVMEGETPDAQASEPDSLTEVWRGPALNKIFVLKEFAEYQRGRHEVEFRNTQD